MSVLGEGSECPVMGVQGVFGVVLGAMANKAGDC